MTIDQLQSFITRRNSSELDTNLQFQIDAIASGISVSDLGRAEKTEHGHRWTTTLGEVRNGRWIITKGELLEDSRIGKLALFVGGKFALGDSRVSLK